MTEIELGELIRPAKVSRAGNNDYPVLSMTMHEGLVDQAVRFKKRIASTDLSGYKVVTKGQLVVGFPIDEGVLDFQELYPAGIVSPAYGIWEIIDEHRVDRRYLRLALRSPRSLAYFRTKLRGSTARRRSLPADVFHALLLRLPSLPEQHRIAAILDHADALRTKRRQVLTHLAALNQSIFTAMFSSDHFNSVPAGVLMPKMRNGLSPATNGTYEAHVLTLSSVTQGRFNRRAVKPGFFSIDPPADKRITNRDFLMCRGNGNKALVGVGTYSRENLPELVFPDTVIAGTVDTTLVTMPFLEAAWKRREVRTQIEAIARTTNGTYKVNQQTLSGVLVPVPPLDLQEDFAAKVTGVAHQRDTAEHASRADDELFRSLQSRAFRGEL